MKRRCPYCDTYQSKLKRHLVRKHTDKKAVQEAMSSKSQKDAFKVFISMGILKTNTEESGKQNPKFERIRQGKSTKDLVMCENCKTFIKRKSMARHSKSCDLPKKCISVDLLSTPSIETSEDFKENVLATLRNDTIGQICKKDPTILIFGYWRYQKVKSNDNIIGSRDSVRRQMRSLAHLYAVFLNYEGIEMQYSNARDMFTTKNFGKLREAIKVYCQNGDDLKAGLKHNLHFTLIAAAKILKAIAYTQDEVGESKVFEKFLSVIDLYKDVIFGDAALKLKRNVDTKIRKPQELPLEAEVTTFRDYTQKNITTLMRNPNKTATFITLRNTICARLTLFNGRRGGEPARLTIKDLKNGLHDKWIDHQRVDWLDDVEKKLLDQMKITHFPGKNNKLVPLFFPRDTIEPLWQLIDSNVRESNGIPSENEYVFASTGGSKRYVSGWSCINEICKLLNLGSSNKINATNNRHRVSTVYSLMDINETERRIFYNHMGHSKEMNEKRYQCPQSMKALKVGKFFLDMDDGNRNLLLVFNYVQITN